jgi:hypothetical protein
MVSIGFIAVIFLLLLSTLALMLAFKVFKNKSKIESFIGEKSKGIFAPLKGLDLQHSWVVVASLLAFILLQALIAAGFPGFEMNVYFSYINWILLIAIIIGVSMMLKPSLAGLSEPGEHTSPLALVFAIAGLLAIMSASAAMFEEWSGSAWQFVEDECENAGDSLTYGQTEELFVEELESHWNFDPVENCQFQSKSHHNPGTNWTNTWVEGTPQPLWYTNSSPSDYSVEGPTMLDEYSTDIPFGPDGPYYWVGYLFLSVFMIGGLSSLSYRTTKFINHKLKLRNLEVSTIRKLALDPDGVVEGRIELPPQMEPSPPSEFESKSGDIILILSTTLTIIGLMAILLEILDGYQYYKWTIYDHRSTGEFVLSAFLLAFIMFSFLCSLAVIKLLKTTFSSGEESLLESVRPREESTQQELPELLAPSSSDEAARLEDVIQSLEHQMIMARLEAETLTSELNETKEKVIVMEEELEEKSEKLDDMKTVLDNMQSIAGESEEPDGKSLVMSDSVLVGDALFGSTKIDSQIINDPAAIARAAIEAYREGRRDGGL